MFSFVFMGSIPLSTTKKDFLSEVFFCFLLATFLHFVLYKNSILVNDIYNPFSSTHNLWAISPYRRKT